MCMSVYMYVCVCVWACLNICMFEICMCVYMYACLYICTCLCICVLHKSMMKLDKHKVCDILAGVQGSFSLCSLALSLSRSLALLPTFCVLGESLIRTFLCLYICMSVYDNVCVWERERVCVLGVRVFEDRLCECGCVRVCSAKTAAAKTTAVAVAAST